jgi:hypothetical protein
MAMNENIQKAAGDFLQTEQGKRLAANRAELEKLAASEDGKRMRALLSGTDLQAAASGGDVSALTSAIADALKTEEGARLARQLRELMK